MDELPTSISGPKFESSADSHSFHLFSELPPELQLKLFFFRVHQASYFFVKSKESTMAVSPKHVPRVDNTPAPIQSFLDVYDRIQRSSEHDGSDCREHRKRRSRPLSEIRCHYDGEWLEGK
ncbi:hypothetical protein FOXYSP1_16264 [Fusarium oxysporum f. sp. phaseoli]